MGQDNLPLFVNLSVVVGVVFNAKTVYEGINTHLNSHTHTYTLVQGILE